jgi:hypothetical protein
MHDLFEGTGTAYIVDAAGNEMKAMASDRAKMMEEASAQWAQSSYRLFLPFKLKDPGVRLAYVEERTGEDATKPKYDVIKVSFDAGVGPTPGDIYYLVVDKGTHLIETVEIVYQGKADSQRLGYRWEAWQDAKGVRYSAMRRNLGYGDPNAPMTAVKVPPAWKEIIPPLPLQVPTSGEVIIFANVEVHGSPNDDRYIPQVE